MALLSERGVEEEGEEEGEDVGGETSLGKVLQGEEEGGGNMEAVWNAEKGGEERGEGGEKVEEVEGRMAGQREVVQWWLAVHHPKAKQLLLRQATTGDQKKPGSARHSQYYRRHGNPNAPRRRATDLRYVLTLPASLCDALMSIFTW